VTRAEQNKTKWSGLKQFGRILRWSVAGLCLGFIVIQFVPVNRANPPVEGDFRGPAEVVSVLQRACYDCHSNQTVWPWYSRIAPVSWVIVHDVNEGRAALNYSTWNQLSAEKQAEAINESWEEVAEGKMPTWYYVALHPEARLSANDHSVLRTWSSSAGGGRESEEQDR
jgi:heme-binding protein